MPLWREQSKAFIPGDIGLGVMLATGWYLYPQISAGSVWGSAIMPFTGLWVGCFTCYLMRTKFDGENNYPLRALRSPTKRYHDFLLYIGYLAVIITICVPAILFGTSWSGNFEVKMVGVTGFAIWLAGMALDATDPKMPEKSKKMHVTDYQPIWKTFPLWWRELSEKMG
ncbi:hypothetical protein HY004_02855 [Candidatus Saccharibacteria bacterium]|nr:hypothetical protein [Candidatus Saccharibacteria bacterium]